VSSIQSKITGHVNKKEKVIYKEGKTQSTETNPSMIEIMQLGDKSHKNAVINMLKNGEEHIKITKSAKDTRKKKEPN
jgi:hypothetical protein